MGVHLDIYLLAEFQASSPDFNLTDLEIQFRTIQNDEISVGSAAAAEDDDVSTLLVRVMRIWMISGEPEWRISVEDQCLHVTSIS